MEKIERFEASAVPIDVADLDTDQLIPARFMKQPRSVGYAQFLLHDRRFEADGSPRSSFPMNQPAYTGAEIIVGGANFGCGSSREPAVYALADYGIRAVIAPSFGGIFFNNALKNGLLPIRLDERDVAALRAAVAVEQPARLFVDLERSAVGIVGGKSYRFEIPQLARTCLLSGMSELDVTLQRRDRIDAFETRYFATHPWVPLEAARDGNRPAR
jgi:3-isopropylmalate/(R)-2-methylmalate dehydratase small subunit